MNTPLLLQLSAQTGAETVFLVPVDHTESDNLHIQVAEWCPDTWWYTLLISHYIILTYSFGAVHKVRYHNTGANVLWFQMSSVLLSHISGSHVHFMSKSCLQSCNRILYGQSLAAYYCLSCDWLLIWPTEGPAIVIVVVCSSPVSSQAHTFTIKLTTMCVSIFLNNIYQ